MWEGFKYMYFNSMLESFDKFLEKYEEDKCIPWADQIKDRQVNLDFSIEHGFKSIPDSCQTSFDMMVE